MNPLLISGFGTSINVDKRKLIIHNKLKNQKLEFYPHKIEHDSIILDGHTGNITFESMRWLMKHNIHLTLLNWNGRLLGVTLPETPITGKLRVKQYQKYLDTKSRYAVAERMVKSKIESSLNLLQELSSFYELDRKKIEKTIKKELQNYQKTENPSHQDLMAWEGRTAELYFKNLGTIFAKLAPEFQFSVRWSRKNRRNYNAADEVNALLNYGYAILESEIRRAINTVGLDYSIGFLHEIFRSRTPLVFDLQELFRWLIDYSVIQLLEEQALTKSDFITTENYHIRLKETTAKKLIEKIKLNFNRKAPYKHRKNHTYQNILFDNVQQLANFVYDNRKDIDFVVPKLQINRKDTIDLREKILALTPEDRKKLGINKSTLWYIQKRLATTKKTKLYDKIFSKLQQLESDNQ